MTRPKTRQDFCKRIRSGEDLTPRTAFEFIDKTCRVFKKRYVLKELSEKLEKLQQLSEIKVKLPQHPSYSYKRARKKKHPTRKPCWVCKGKATCQHHIILLKNGGSDGGINRIPICEACHKQIHSWMA